MSDELARVYQLLVRVEGKVDQVLELLGERAGAQKEVPDDGVWNCDSCNSPNAVERGNCGGCGATRPARDPTYGGLGWTCPHCPHCANANTRETCLACGRPRPTERAAKAPG